MLPNSRYKYIWNKPISHYDHDFSINYKFFALFIHFNKNKKTIDFFLYVCRHKELQVEHKYLYIHKTYLNVIKLKAKSYNM